MSPEHATRFDPRVHCSGIFDRLERLTPDERAHLFFALELRWCWDCGAGYEACSCANPADRDRMCTVECAVFLLCVFLLGAACATLAWILA